MSRVDTLNFSTFNNSETREPRYVVEIAFDDARTDLYYLTSHAGTLLPASVTTNVSQGVLSDVSAVSQSLDPVNSRFTIGNASFEAVDITGDLTDVLNDKWLLDKTTAQKVVKIYVGFNDLTSWDDYTLIQTQILSNIIATSNSYKWICNDIQRSLKNKIFEPYKTTLRGVIDRDDTFIPAFEVVDGRILHDSQYDDAPSSTVGYIRVDDEIIRYSSVVTTAGAQGYNVDTGGRGVLNTRAAEHGIDASEIHSDGTVSLTNGSAAVVGVNSDFQKTKAGGIPVISAGDMFYLPKSEGGDGLLYEILSVNSPTSITLKTVYAGTTVTNKTYKILSKDITDRQPKIEEVIYIQGAAPKIALKLLTGTYGGETFPSNWHLGIDSTFVASSLFTGIGSDWWDTSTDEGVFLRFVSPKAQDGKKFIEKEIMQPIGGFMPVAADGQLGLKRMTGVLSDASTVKELDETNVVSFSAVTFDESAIRNNFVIQWNWDSIAQKFTRNTVVVDTDSQAKFSSSRVQSLRFLGVHGSKTTEQVLISNLDAMRDRVAGYPKKMTLEVMPGSNELEPGDIVRVVLPQVPDHTGVSKALDSAFEVQRISTDWTTGNTSVELFGSSYDAQSSESVAQSDKKTALWYQSEGTDLSSVLTIDGSGNIANGQTLTGGTTMQGSIFYYVGDLTLPSGFTLTITNNIQLRVLGFVQIDGTIDGQGNGLAGVAASAGLGGTAGAPGYIGQTQSDGGQRIDFHAKSFRTNTAHIEAKRSTPTTGRNPSGKIPLLNLSWVSDALVGISGDFRPTSGGGGGAVQYESSTPVNGGDGGSGGAALVIVHQGFACGISGVIDLDGDQGLGGGFEPTTGADLKPYAGSGASGCGGPLYLIADGSTSTVGDVNFSSVRPTPVTPYTQRSPSSYPELRLETSDPWFDIGPYYEYAAGLNSSTSNTRIQYLPSSTEAIADTSTTTGDVSAVSVAQVLDTFAQTTKVVSLEISVTEPTDGNYSNSVAYGRSGSELEWRELGVIPNNGELTIDVAADGAVWEIQARSVSIFNVESPSGPSASITVINLINPTQTVGIGDQETIAEQIPVPDVTGIEIFGQGNDQEFIGKDCKIGWNRVAGVNFQEFGNEPDGLGADSGFEDYYFDVYVVRVFDTSGNALRVETTKDDFYIYSFEKNAEDYKRINGTDGSLRTFRFEVTVRTIDNRESAKAARLLVENPVASLLSAVSLSGVFQGINFKATTTDIDFAGVRVWVSTTQGFTPGPSTLVYDGANLEFNIPRLLSNTIYYVVYSPYDTYGIDDTNLSSELSVTTQASLAGASSGGFVDTVAVGGAFVATGSNAWADIDPGDTVTIPNGTWRLDMGPVSDGGTTYVLRFHDGNGNKTFSLDSDGNSVFGGSVEAGEFISTPGTGKRIEINPSSDNEIHFYGDRGDTTIEELATIGISAFGGDNIVGLFGTITSTNIGVLGVSDTLAGVKGQSSSLYGVEGYSSNRTGLPPSHEGYGGAFHADYINDGTKQARPLGNMRLIPMTASLTYSTDPNGLDGEAGAFWCGSDGSLWYNKTGSTTWISLA